MGFFDWFRKEKPASEHLTLNSIEFPWPKDKRTNHPRGKEHWQHSYCLGSKKEAMQIQLHPCSESDKLLKWGYCPSCGKRSRVTHTDRTFHHLPVSSVS